MTLIQRNHEDDDPIDRSADANAPALNIRVITHNIRYATKSPFKGEELWSIRRPRLCAQIKFNSVLPESFICLQEVLHQQLLDILASLNPTSEMHQPEWKAIGVGRDDGKEAGEYSPILYRPDIWQLVGSSHRWLRPDYTSPGKGWDASSIRIITYARFQHKSSGRLVLLWNTHLDNNGAVARLESVKLILGWIRQVSDDVSSVILTGDFNSPPTDDAYSLMIASESPMEDVASQVPESERYGNEITYTSFGHVDNNPARIDFIFARKSDELKYNHFGVLANRFDDAVYISDHRACVADVSIL